MSIYNPYVNHVEESVNSAHPLELVALLFQSLRDSIRQGRKALADGDIAARSNALSSSLEILAELANSVDRQKGGELALRLVSIYAFTAERIQEGNFHQSDKPLAEAERVLQPIAEAWQTLASRLRETEPCPISPHLTRATESAHLSLCG
jgi:flagellar protein FliS